MSDIVYDLDLTPAPPEPTRYGTYRAQYMNDPIPTIPSERDFLVEYRRRVIASMAQSTDNLMLLWGQLGLRRDE